MDFTERIKNYLNSVDWYLLQKVLNINVDKDISKVISTHRKKLKNLTKNTVLPFSPNEIVNNLSSLNLTDDELELLKNVILESSFSYGAGYS